MAKNNEKEKSLEQWLWDAACAIRGAQDAPKFKDYILPLVFTKRLCDVFDDEVNRVAEKVSSRTRALQLIEKDHKLVRFYLPLRAKDLEKDRTWEVVRLLVAKENESVGQQLTDIMRSIARENKPLDGIINRIDFNATTHGQRDIDDDSLNRLISKISEKGLGLQDVEPDIIGRSYEYLIRKFAEGGGQSAGEFYTPREVGMIMARILNPEPGMEAYDPNTGSAGLLIKMQLVLQEKMHLSSKKHYAPLKLYGQEFNPATWAMANMNMVIHDIEGQIAIGNTMTNPSRFDVTGNALKKFDLVTANPMWNQDSFSKSTYDNDELNRFGHTHPDGTVVDFPPSGTADWAWAQHILASMKDNGRAAIILDTGAVSRGSGSTSKSAEKDIRKWFVENDLIEAIVYLPENLFYNTGSPGIILILNKAKTDRAGEILLINATKHFVKGTPKNYIDEESANLIVDTFHNWVEVERFSRIVNREEIEKFDFNLSPTRFIHTADDVEHRDIEELVTEMTELVEESDLLDKELSRVLNIFTDDARTGTHKKSEVGLIPDNWDVKNIGSFCSIKTNTLSFSELTSVASNNKGDIKVLALKVSDMNLVGNETTISRAVIEFRISASHPKFNRLIKPGSIIFPKRGAAIATNKKRLLSHFAILDPNLIALEPNEFCEPGFLYYYFLTFDLRRLTDNNTIPQLNKKDLEPLLIPLPPLDEQRQIKSALDTMAASIIHHNKKTQTLNSLFGSMLHQSMSGNVQFNKMVQLDLKSQMINS